LNQYGSRAEVMLLYCYDVTGHAAETLPRLPIEEEEEEGGRRRRGRGGGGS